MIKYKRAGRLNASGNNDPSKQKQAAYEIAAQICQLILIMPAISLGIHAETGKLGLNVEKGSEILERETQ